MRQVDEAELIVRLMFQLGRMSASMRNDLSSRTPDVRKSAERRLAQHLVQKGLARLEILSDTPDPAGTDLYSRAAYAQGGTGAPAIEAVD